MPGISWPGINAVRRVDPSSAASVVRNVEPLDLSEPGAIAYVPAYPRLSAPLVLLLLQPYSLSRDNLVRLKTHRGESLASIKDDDVFDFCTGCIEE